MLQMEFQISFETARSKFCNHVVFFRLIVVIQSVLHCKGRALTSATLKHKKMEKIKNVNVCIHVHTYTVCGSTVCRKC